MERTRRRFVMLAALIGFATSVATGHAQSLGNRDMHTMSIAPDPAGGSGQIVTGYWTVDVEPTSTPLDLSTRVELCVNGTVVHSITEDIAIDGGSGVGCASGPPCSGGCGTGTLNGANVSLHCYKADCNATGCTCDCGVWISTEFPPIDLAIGDGVEVKVFATAGAAPDNDDTDNGVDAPYTGIPLGWNRTVPEIEFVEVGGGLYDIGVNVETQWDGVPVRLTLDTIVELHVNGSLVATTGVPVETTQIFDQGCFEAGCGNQCGTYNGIPSFCDPFLWWTCGCGANTWINFENTPVEPGDEIMVLLRPVPGALPELPGFEDDDLFLDFCCGTVGVGENVTPSMRLEQNRPNPFNPRTSISFDVDGSGWVELHVLDATGRAVKTLLRRELGAGSWSVSWDGTSDRGEPAASGVYFYRLVTEHGVETRRMTLLK